MPGTHRHSVNICSVSRYSRKPLSTPLDETLAATRPHSPVAFVITTPSLRVSCSQERHRGQRQHPLEISEDGVFSEFLQYFSTPVCPFLLLLLIQREKRHVRRLRAQSRPQVRLSKQAASPSASFLAGKCKRLSLQDKPERRGVPVAKKSDRRLSPLSAQQTRLQRPRLGARRGAAALAEGAVGLTDSKSPGRKGFHTPTPRCLSPGLLHPTGVKQIRRPEMGVEVYNDPEEIRVS